MEMKPLKFSGSFVVGSDFEILKFTKKQATYYAKYHLRKSRIHGCKKTSVKDYGEFYVYSIW